MTRSRSGCASPASARSGRSSCPNPAPDEVLVRTLYSGVSRGTETLVFRGGVPASQYAVMRAPFQDGRLSRARSSTATSTSGSSSRDRRTCWGATCSACIPHQTAYVVPVGAVVVVPDDVPPARAVLAGTVETAVNVLWDAAPLLGDRITVVGAGMVGCCVARLLARFPGVEVTLVDTEPSRAGIAAALGVDFALPADCDGGSRSGRARQCDWRGSATVAGPARAGGRRHRRQLVRRHRGLAVARRRVPFAAAEHPGQSGGHGGARPPGPPQLRRSPLAWHWRCCGTTPLTR